MFAIKKASTIKYDDLACHSGNNEVLNFANSTIVNTINQLMI